MGCPFCPAPPGKPTDEAIGRRRAPGFLRDVTAGVQRVCEDAFGDGLVLIVRVYSLFGHEELGDEVRMGSAQNNLMTTSFFTHIQNQAFEAVTHAGVFPRHLLTIGHHRFRLQQIDNHVATLNTPHGT